VQIARGAKKEREKHPEEKKERKKKNGKRLEKIIKIKEKQIVVLSLRSKHKYFVVCYMRFTYAFPKITEIK